MSLWGMGSLRRNPPHGTPQKPSSYLLCHFLFLFGCLTLLLRGRWLQVLL